MKRLLTTLIILGLIGFAGYKAAVWWLTDQRLAEARAELEPWGVLKRGTIGSGIDGHLVLSEGHWQDFRLTQPLEFSRLEVSAGSPVNLLLALADPSRMPENWSARVDGLSLALEATMFRNWVTAGGENGEGEPAVFVLSCAPDPRQQISSGDLMRMGIPGLTGELLIRQSADRLHAELNTAGTGSVEFNWPGVRLNPLHPEALFAAGSGPLHLVIRDGGLMRRITAYCARESGNSPQAWASLAVNAFSEGLKARGLEASKQLLALYRQWLVDGGELALTLDLHAPAYGIPVDEPGSARAGTGWEVEYNGASVPDVYLKKVAPAAQPSANEQPEPVAPPENPGQQRWYTDTVENAGNWIDYKVRVTLSNENTVVGRLVSVTDREIEVARVVAGGEVAYPMLVRAIARFDVWRRGRTEQP
jgi:hypothetical protein